jgi:hypothetical protein
MKTVVFGIFFALACVAAFGQARPGAYPWTISIEIVDAYGKPVQNARICVAYGDLKQGDSSDPFQPNGWAVAGYTDKNGTYSAGHTDHSWELGIGVEKSGYYPTHIGYELYKPGQFDDQKVAANRNPKLTLTLKKIEKPIPMYARHVDGGPPVFNEPVGYDLIMGDWVAPHGKGQVTDMIFNGKLDKKSKNDFDYELIVSFPEKGDGLQMFSVPVYYLGERGSRLQSAAEAPQSGYQPQVVRTRSRHPGVPPKQDMNDPNRNYYFRVRTELDEKGNVKSALYGKMYGDFMRFDYYLDPTPNDRNVEFDQKHNLSKNMKPGEGVEAP